MKISSVIKWLIILTIIGIIGIIIWWGLTSYIFQDTENILNIIGLVVSLFAITLISGVFRLGRDKEITDIEKKLFLASFDFLVSIILLLLLFALANFNEEFIKRFGLSNETFFVIIAFILFIALIPFIIGLFNVLEELWKHYKSVGRSLRK